MNEECQISAELQHNFHLLAHFNSKTTEPIFTIFSSDKEQFVELLMHTSAMQWCISFQNMSVKSEDGQFWRLQKKNKINWLPYQHPLNYVHKTYVSFIICIHTSTEAKTLGKSVQ